MSKYRIKQIEEFNVNSATNSEILQFDGTDWANVSLSSLNLDGIYSGDGTIPTSTTASMTDTLQFGTSLLFTLDETNDVIGMGTDDPFNAPPIHGGGATYHPRFVVKTDNQRYGFAHTDGTIELNTYVDSTTPTGYAGGMIGVSSTHNLHFYVDDTTRLTIATSGNVGIGTLPTERLHVQGSLRLVDGTEGNGYVMISDASGVASWTASSNVGDGNGIYDGSGTVPTSTIATVTDTLTFDEGQVIIKGVDNTNSELFLLENNTGIDFFRVQNDGAWSLGYNTVPTSSQNVNIGYHSSPFSASASQSVLIGAFVTDNQSVAQHVAIGAYADVTGTTPAVAVGYHAATLTGGVAIGLNALAGSSGISIGNSSDAADGVGIGNGAQATGAQAHAIGRASVASGNESQAFGYSAEATQTGAIAIGQQSTASGNSSISIGWTPTASGTRSISIGKSSISSGNDSISIGYESEILSVANSVAIGTGTEVTAVGAQMIGWKSSPTLTKVTNSTANSVGFGWDETTPSVLFAKTADSYINGSGNLGIGTASPTTRLHVQGSLRLVDGTEGNGYVLISDGTGVASWTASSGIADGNGIYDGSGTVPTSTIATVTDTLTFDGQVIIKGAGATLATKSLSIQNSALTEKFFVRDDGMVSATDGYSIDGSLFVHGSSALSSTYVGKFSGLSNTSGLRNVGIGNVALYTNVSGTDNTAIGYQALKFATSNKNTAIGQSAAANLTTGANVVAIGDRSLNLLTISGNAVGVGQLSGSGVTAAGNTFVGHYAGWTGIGQISTVANSIAIGKDAWTDTNYQMTIGKGITEVVLGIPKHVSPYPVTLRTSNRVGTDGSSLSHLTIAAGAGTGTGLGANILFKTAPAGTTGSSQNPLVTAMTIQQDGNVGIGNSLPTTAKLNVVGTTLLESGLTTIQGAGATLATKSLSIQNSALTEKFFVRDDGMVSATDGYSINGIISFHTTGTRNTFLGNYSGNTSVTGVANTGVGYKSLALITSGIQNVVIGDFSGDKITGGSFNTIVGENSGRNITAGNFNILIGEAADVTTNISSTVVIGNSVEATAPGQFVTGNNVGLRDYFFNKGITTTTFGSNSYIRFQPTGGVGTDIDASQATFYIAGARGTGTGLGSDIKFQTAPAGTTGSTQNPLVTAMTIQQDGNVGIGNSLPTAKLHVVGDFRLVDGTESSGYILTSDSTGVGTWQASASGTVNKETGTASFTGGVTSSISHNLNTEDLIIQCYDSNGIQVVPGVIDITGTGSVDIYFSTTLSNVKTVIMG